MVYANGVDWPALLAGGPPNRGILSAVAADGSRELWHLDTPFSPNMSGVAVANGVVYFQSISGTFYAVDAKTGGVLATVATGGESSGPAVSRGQVYLGTGTTAFQFIVPELPLLPGAIIAMGVDDPRAPAAADGPSLSPEPVRAAGPSHPGRADVRESGPRTRIARPGWTEPAQVVPTTAPPVEAATAPRGHGAAGRDADLWDDVLLGAALR